MKGTFHGTSSKKQLIEHGVQTLETVIHILFHYAPMLSNMYGTCRDER